MKMIHNYEEFCNLYDQGKVNPDVTSNLGYNSVEYLRKQGWKMDTGGLFRRPRPAKDLLMICRQSADNFELAYRKAGIDFWTKED